MFSPFKFQVPKHQPSRVSLSTSQIALAVNCCTLEALQVVVGTLGHLEGHNKCDKDRTGSQELEVPHHASLLLRRRRVVDILCHTQKQLKKGALINPSI